MQITLKQAGHKTQTTQTAKIQEIHARTTQRKPQEINKQIQQKHIAKHPKNNP